MNNVTQALAAIVQLPAAGAMRIDALPSSGVLIVSEHELFIEPQAIPLLEGAAIDAQDFAEDRATWGKNQSAHVFGLL